MKIAEVMKAKNKTVKIRVPSHLRDKLGETTKGEVRSVKLEDSVTWVRVKVGNRLFKFRPQDLTAA